MWPFDELLIDLFLVVYMTLGTLPVLLLGEMNIWRVCAPGMDIV